MWQSGSLCALCGGLLRHDKGGLALRGSALVHEACARRAAPVPPEPELEEAVRGFLDRRRGERYCHICLALDVGCTEADVHLCAARLDRDAAVRLVQETCSRCSETRMTIEMVGAG